MKISPSRWIRTTFGAPAAPPSTPGGPKRPWSMTKEARASPRKKLDLVVHAEAAALLAGAAGALTQREAAEQHGIVLLHHLDRRRSWRCRWSSSRS